MPKFKYAGAEPVDVPALGLVDVAPGDEVDVTDDVGAGLDGQPQWELVEDKPEPKSVKKATVQVADDSQEG